MKKLVIVISSIICASFFGIAVNAQSPSLELSWLNGSWNPGAGGPTQGPSTVSQLQTFQNDLINNSTFIAYSPAITVTTALRNQVFTGYNYTGQQGTVSTGLSFGTQKSEWNDLFVTTQGPRKGNLYDLLGANVGAYGPTASLYKSFAGEALGTIDADFSQFGLDGNGGVTLFSTVEPLKNMSGVNKAGRYEYGELVITFSRPVKDPVLHLASLGGSSWYQVNVGSAWNIAYFSTELELVTPGFSSVKLSGTPYFDIQGNNILNNAARPNGDSQIGAIDVKGFSTYGSASGSVQIIGVVTQLVYKVYLRGSDLSDYPFTFDAVSILGASRNPFYGDYWSISYSMKKPTQQISGYVFDDSNGILTDNNITQSGGIDNTKTNAGGTLYANLIKANIVEAVVPIGSDGSYLFDNVQEGNYTVELSSIAGTVGSAPPAATLPSGWVNTGENIGSSAGTDGTVDGFSTSIIVNASEIKTEVNFGIERLPESISYLRPIPTPSVGTIITLNSPSLPVLSGSDPEDMPTTGELTGKTIQITTLPTNTTLRYNLIPVTAGQIIPLFDASKLQIQITSASVGSLNTSFTYAYVDAAGFADPTPAEYKLVWAGGAPLPVTGVNLKASLNGKDVVLNWKTSSEYNSKQFEIERSTDAANFKLINTKAAAGTSFNELAYSITDANMTAKVYFYRLRLVDLDGKFTYSNVAVVRQTDNKGIKSFPNPVASQLNIEFANAKGAYIISMFNQAGQEVQSTRANIENSVQYVTLQRNNLTAGTYFVRITNIATAEVHTEKIILQ